MTSNPHIEIIEKAVYAACTELVKKTHNSTFHRYDYTYDTIHLEHILRALGEQGLMSVEDSKYLVFLESNTQIYYNLGNSLYDQLPSTLEWLANISK